MRSVAALERSVGLATDRYLYGLASYYEVLEAEERLFPAQNAQASIRLNRLRAYVQLYKALGGGWNVKDPQSMPPSSDTAAPAPSWRRSSSSASWTWPPQCGGATTPPPCASSSSRARPARCR
jgi:hypothetical protein